MNVYHRLFDEVRPHWKLAAAGIGFSLAMAILELVPSVLTRYLVDNALTQKNLQMLYWLSGGMLVGLIAYSITYYGRMWYTGKLSQAVLCQLRTRLYEHLQKLSLSFYDNKRTGEVMSRVTNDVSVLEQFIAGGIRDLLVNVLKVVLIAAILFWRDPTLALLTLVPTLPLIWATKVFKDRIQAEYRSMSKRMAEMNSILSDTLGGIREMQLFTQEENEAQKFRRKTDEYQVAGLATQRLQAIFYPGVNLAFGVGQVVVWVWGGRQVLAGQLTAGDLIMFSTLVAQFYAPVQALSQISNLFASASASGERVYEILDTQPDVKTEETARPLPEASGEITFDNIQFGYDGAKPTLKDISLEVKPGEMIGLVGPSGSGKSTLAALVSRSYDVSEGAVKVDGQDVRDLDLKDLRRNVSIVLQEPYLFHGTIRENISYGRPDADFSAVMNAARKANAHGFIMDLPDAYDTHVGERGVKLSGGQRQRLSIARAILDDPRILILDEATSAVDTESEVQIQEALDELMEGRTTLAIAHRLSTVKNADKLVVLEEGRIVETGTHDELVQNDGSLYKRLVEMQTKLSEKEKIA